MQGLRAGVARKGCTRRVARAGVVCRVVCRGCAQGLHAQRLRAGVASLFVHGYHWLPLATIDLVGDSREFEV